MADVEALFDDLRDEGNWLDSLVASLDTSAWQLMTPAAGWTISHQIAHLCWTDETSTVAIVDSGAFQQIIERALENIEGFVDAEAEVLAAIPATELLTRWRNSRHGLLEALQGVPQGQKLPWFGPPMSAASMATARLMETFAHGCDIADTLEVPIVPTHRHKHICHIGVRTRDFAYNAHGLTPPSEPFRYVLRGPKRPNGQRNVEDGVVDPDGNPTLDEDWIWGPEDAANRVVGSALDFCFLVTQRRHIDDLDLEFIGEHAKEWSQIAQAFAGPPGEGRQPLTAQRVNVPGSGPFGNPNHRPGDHTTNRSEDNDS